MSDWRPIETAPKDGTPILARSKGYSFPFVIFWSARCIVFGPMPALPDGSVIGKDWLLSCADDPAEVMETPDEWIPLPD